MRYIGYKEQNFAKFHLMDDVIFSCNSVLFKWQWLWKSYGVYTDVFMSTTWHSSHSNSPATEVCKDTGAVF